MIAASNGKTANYVPPRYGDLPGLQGSGAGCSLVPQAPIDDGNPDHPSLVNYTIISYPADFKPFLCHVCNKSFSSKNSRNKHHRNLHLMERKECSICKKVFSNVYNLKRHMQSAHGAYLNQKTGAVQKQCDARPQQTPSPVLSEENSTEALASGAEINNFGFREWEKTPSSSPESRESTPPSDYPSSNSPNTSGGSPFQSYFEAFIPPRYRNVPDGNFEDYISDDDNLNFLEDDDDVNAILDGLNKEKTSAVVPVADILQTRRRSQSPPTLSPDLGSQKCYFDQLGLIPVENAAGKNYSGNNNDHSFANKENQIEREEFKSMRKKAAFLRAERAALYLEVEAFKNSAEGRSERAKIRRKGKAEKERIRRLWGKASRKSNRVARKKGRDSPQDLQPMALSTSEGKVAQVDINKAVASQHTGPVSPTRNVRVTRQRSKTK